jgi:hypothetical protein
MHAYTDRPQMLEDFQQLGAVSETMVPLSNARVVVADYRRLFADFPWLLSNKSETAARQAADAWLLANAAVVSPSQAVQAVANSPIRAELSRTVPGVRLPRQGRSVFVSARRDGGGSEILNVKGVGVSGSIEPARARQRNGLIPLYCALYEFLMHRLVAAAFAHAGAPHRVLPAYAVIDTGFDELELDADIGCAAGILVRAAHYRTVATDLPRSGSVMQRAAAEAEFVLRHYGLTSNVTSPWLTIRTTPAGLQLYRWGQLVPDYPPDRLARLHKRIGGGQCLDFDGINLQYTDHFDWGLGGVELIDLHYAVRPVFDLPVVATVCDREFGWGGYLWPDHPKFVQPVPGLLCDPALWAKRVPTAVELKTLNLRDSKPMDGGILFCLDAAQKFRSADGIDPAALFGIVERTVAQWSPAEDLGVTP